MSDYRKIQQTPEYREARQEVRAMIEAFLKPLHSQLDVLEARLTALEARLPKG
jgi:outer membrane protein TolC